MGYTIYTKIVGTTFCKGQDYLNQLKPGNQLILKRDYENEYDPFAVAVYTSSGDCGNLPTLMLGYIKAELARELAHLLGMGVGLSCEVVNITGGVVLKEKVGCNIKISRVDKK